MKPRFIDMDAARQEARKEEALQEDVRVFSMLLDLQVRGDAELPAHYLEARAKADEQTKQEKITDVEVRAARRKFLAEMWIPRIETEYATLEARRDMAEERDEDTSMIEERLDILETTHRVACEALDGLLEAGNRQERRAAAKTNGKGRATPKAKASP